MSEILKNSLILYKIGAFFRLLSVKWSESNIGWIVTRNFDDIKTKNSFIYRFCSAVVSKLNSATPPSAFAESLLLNAFSHYEYGVYLLILALPFLPTVFCAAIAAVTVLSFLWNFFLKKEVKLSSASFSVNLALMLAVFFISAAFSYTRASSVMVFALYLVFTAAIFPVINCGRDKTRLRKMIFMFVFAGFFVSLYGIFQHFFGDNTGHAWIDEEMFSDIKVRVYSTFENPNVLGEYLIMLIPLCGAMIYGAKRFWSKCFYFVVIASAAVCLLFTQSRGCWLGIILAAVIFAFFVDKRLVALGIIALMFAPTILPESIVNRFLSIGNMSDSSTSYRVYIWLGTLRMLKSFWWNGIGLGTEAFNRVYPIYSYSAVTALHSHNLYLQLVTESGAAGILAFAAVMLTSLKKIVVGHIAAKGTLHGFVCVAVLGGVFGFLLQGMFDYSWYNYRVFAVFWMYIAIGISSAKCACEENSVI